MSRGGRGGAYSGPPGARLNHGTVPFEISPELLAQSEELHKNAGLFPHMDVPRPKPLSRDEKINIEAYRELRAKRQLGPYYFPSTLRDLSHRQKRHRIGRGSERAMFNAFEDQKTYMAVQDDMRRAFKEAEYSKLPFPKDLLPKELWGVCGLATDRQCWPNMHGDNKSLLSMQQKLARIDDVDDAEEVKDDAEEPEEKEPANDDSEADDNAEKEDEDAASDRDDDFEDGEDDMAADYNAEQYFDGGEDDNDDLGPGDGGGGGDDW